MKIKPIRRQIYVRKCTTGTKVTLPDGSVGYKLGNIFVTDIRGEYSLWAQILDVADDCRYFTKDHIGGFVRLREWSPRYIRAVVPEIEFMVKEEYFEKEPQAVAAVCKM